METRGMSFEEETRGLVLGELYSLTDDIMDGWDGVHLLHEKGSTLIIVSIDKRKKHILLMNVTKNKVAELNFMEARVYLDKL